LPNLPSPDEKRKVLHDPSTSADTLNRLADDFRAADRLGETLEMLAVTRDEKRLRALRELAISRGEVFVLTQTERFLGDEASAKDWMAAGEKALSEERFRQAEAAFLRAGDEEKAAGAAEKIPAAPKSRPEKAVEAD